ncbi:MAG: helix-turn-helix domain-containing protein [Devosia sp.]|nr:helix-turn-helix domain-containing protein [Devosia sp.]
MNDLVRKIELQSSLTPQLKKIITHVNRVGYITVRAAMMDYGIGSLSRRMSDLQERGFTVTTQQRTNPGTGQRYVRYFVTHPADEKSVAA